MRVFNLYLKEYDWLVRVFLSVDTYYMDEISDALIAVGCPRDMIASAFKSLNDSPNTGLCYSNPKERMSVIVTHKASTSGEFVNSITHEISHLACNIAQEDGVGLDGEGLAYIVGNIAMAIYPYCKDLICPKCMNDKIYKRFLA